MIGLVPLHMNLYSYSLTIDDAIADLGHKSVGASMSLHEVVGSPPNGIPSVELVLPIMIRLSDQRIGSYEQWMHCVFIAYST